MSLADFPSELFLPFLNQDNNVPQYVALFRAFQQAIVKGHLIAGAKLPATRPLATALSVSRNTVKTAYEMLLAEGYIETKHGAGSFVSTQLPEQFVAAKCSNANATNHRPALSLFSQRTEQLIPTQTTKTGSLLRPAHGCVQSFPWSQWQKHVTKAAHTMKYASLNSVLGAPLLREQIASYLNVARGVKCHEKQIIICSGSQQALYLSLQLLVNQGDHVMIENPGYSGIGGSIDAMGAVKVPVTIDQHGFSLEDGLAQSPNARVALITPSRNYPMGYTLSLDRRLALINWAKQNKAWIIEDDYDSEFRFDGPPLSSMQGLGGEKCVIYTGTFSRILHSSIRIGYLVVPESLVDVFSQAKQFMDGGLSQLPQLALGEFMATGQFTSHVRRMRKLYQQRRDTLKQLVDETMPNILQRVETDGGMHSVFLLPEGYSDIEICQKANAQDLGIYALSSYYVGKQKQQGLLIGFAGDNEESMKHSIYKLAQIINTGHHLSS
ncbi:PLP-dependent aminotransferase family protein [Leucothrix arctica]|uniref:HTH gntR-type domain-containing protein n=1 Tax=Leucothrix arctica TaxID=1481894 RepID=A0A317CGF4_9GAMM|nr:PLP-dependent aminotransferase family protein [Leucothrix arctica]PWQ97608.1 hypothetical protein DKT75_06730 [Leucothrix arctica]